MSTTGDCYLFLYYYHNVLRHVYACSMSLGILSKTAISIRIAVKLYYWQSLTYTAHVFMVSEFFLFCFLQLSLCVKKHFDRLRKQKPFPTIYNIIIIRLRRCNRRVLLLLLSSSLVVLRRCRTPRALFTCACIVFAPLNIGSSGVHSLPSNTDGTTVVGETETT